MAIFFFVQYAHSFGEKKALLNKNMYLYSKSVLPAYLITKKKEKKKRNFKNPNYNISFKKV